MITPELDIVASPLSETNCGTPLALAISNSPERGVFVAVSAPVPAPKSTALFAKVDVPVPPFETLKSLDRVNPLNVGEAVTARS